jgi:hypothetical protein
LSPRNPPSAGLQNPCTGHRTHTEHQVRKPQQSLSSGSRHRQGSQLQSQNLLPQGVAARRGSSPARFTRESPGWRGASQRTNGSGECRGNETPPGRAFIGARWPAGDSCTGRPGRPQSRLRSGMGLCRAEGEGFEPSRRLTTPNGFRDRHGFALSACKSLGSDLSCASSRASFQATGHRGTARPNRRPKSAGLRIRSGRPVSADLGAFRPVSDAGVRWSSLESGTYFGTRFRPPLRGNRPAERAQITLAHRPDLGIVAIGEPLPRVLHHACDDGDLGLVEAAPSACKAKSNS